MTGLIPFNRRSNELDNLSAGTIYNMIDDFFSNSGLAGSNSVSDSFKLDVKEKDANYIIEAELPGVEREDIDLDLTKDRLTISVKTATQATDEKEHYLHRERRVASASRTIRLGDGAFDNISAKLDNGLLTITLPKKTPVNTSTKISIA
ncbi:MAG: Hsp20/alpha crystallin family protein [Lachnospiraceae bacterium]|jgi:HSP20 family protein|nr:Hsp20/alpha crystallin family protein [Lachnospiraceae bacterium]